jgi:hypothetical protein
MTVGELRTILAGYDANLPVTASRADVLRDGPHTFQEADVEMATKMGARRELTRRKDSPEPEDAVAVIVLRFREN